MKRFSEQFNTRAKTVKMTAAEKTVLRERVVSYMEYHPLPTSSAATRAYTETSLMPSWFNSSLWRQIRLGSVATVALIFTVSLVAEQAVPGDALYSIKKANEEVRGTLTIGSYEKVVWETERLNRRMSEARILASEGRLTAEAEVEVAEAVKKHSDNARKEIEVMRLTDEDDATLAAIELTTAISVQSDSFMSVAADTIDKQATDLIEEVMKDAAEAVAVVTEESNLPAFDKLMAKVESETTRAYELLSGISKTATSEEQSEVKRRLEDIERKVVSAQDSKETNEILARESLMSTLEQTHKLIVFMTDIDVRAALTVEEVVPVTLTEAERIEAVKIRTAEIEDILKRIEASLTATNTEPIATDILDKVIVATEAASTSLAQVYALLAVEGQIDVATAEGVVLEGYNLVMDSSRLLNLDLTKVVEVNDESVVPVMPDVLEDIVESNTASSTDEIVPTNNASTTEAVSEVDPAV